jgi:SagB-type dehydrogenase family enzyme
VDGEREATLALCALGRSAAPMPDSPPVTALHLPFRAPSAREVVFPEIAPMHHASELASGAEAAAWRAAPLRRQAAEPRGPLIPLRPLPDEQLPAEPLDAVIRKRRSTRHYASETPVPCAAVSTLLAHSTRGVAADCLALDAPPLHDAYLIVNNVAELEPGVYRLHSERQALELLRAGEFRQQAGRLALGQQYAAEAHVNHYYLTDLDAVLARYGNRGYRLAQLECALYASKLHVGTHALGLGAAGSGSFDDEVSAFFAPHADGQSYMFVLTSGLKRRRAASA